MSQRNKKQLKTNNNVQEIEFEECWSNLDETWHGYLRKISELNSINDLFAKFKKKISNGKFISSSDKWFKFNEQSRWTDPKKNC